MEWGIGRSGSRIQQAFDEALQQARSRSEVNMDGLFLQGLSATVSVRVPTEDSATVRPVALVAPAELDLAILLLLGDAGPTDRHKLREHWKRLFGWRRVGSEIEVAFEEAVERLLSAGRIGGPDPLRAR